MQKFTTASLAINGTLRKISGTSKWVVQDPFLWYIDYYDHSKGAVVIPAGYGTDFGTIPLIFRPIFNPTAYLSYVLHDYLYTFRTYSRKECDRILREALITEGMNKLGVFTIYTAVRSFGWIYY